MLNCWVELCVRKAVEIMGRFQIINTKSKKMSWLRDLLNEKNGLAPKVIAKYNLLFGKD